MMKSPLIIGLLMSMLTLSLVACDDDDDMKTPNSEKTVFQIAADDSQFSTLVDALRRVNLDEVLNGDGPFTVFAPTNAAFTALGVNLSTLSDDQLSAILLYHVFVGAGLKASDIQNGQTYIGTASNTGPNNSSLSALIEKTSTGVSLNGSIKVTQTDIIGKNGVIHVIDAVLQPLDLVGHAQANANFSTLVGALGTATGGLVDVLSATGPFTVFAPVNQAFTAISATVATLTPAQLASVLTYHVVAGNVRSSNLSNGQVVTTVQGETFTVNIQGNSVSITDAQNNRVNVLLTDVQATNGVIHVLDKVLLPENL
ncbi:MAG: fasciclin domain-containing protein [Saprospiraceae bacterium]|nr:fasciclin domain-containing protein [Saprospiraceae bacterium]